MSPELTDGSPAPLFPVAAHPFAAVWTKATGRERSLEVKEDLPDQPEAADSALNTAAFAAMLAIRPLATQQQVALHPGAPAGDIRTESEIKEDEAEPVNSSNTVVTSQQALASQTMTPQQQPAAVAQTLRRPAAESLPQTIPAQLRTQLSAGAGSAPRLIDRPGMPPAAEAAEVLSSESSLPDSGKPSIPAGFVQTSTWTSNAATSGMPFAALAYSLSEPQSGIPAQQRMPAEIPSGLTSATPPDTLPSPREWQRAVATDDGILAKDAPSAAVLYFNAGIDGNLPVSATGMTSPDHAAGNTPVSSTPSAPQTQAAYGQNTGIPAGKILSLDVFASEGMKPEQPTGSGHPVASAALVRDSGRGVPTAMDSGRSLENRPESGADDIDASTVKAGHETFSVVPGSVPADTAEKPNETAQARPVIMQPLHDDAPLQASGEARQIALDVRGDDGSVVKVRFSANETGHLQLNVYSNDEILSREVRSGAADLITRLEDHGFDVRSADTTQSDTQADTNEERRRKQTAPDEEEFRKPRRKNASADSVFQVHRT